MSTQPITQQPTFELLPDEYVRYEYRYKPGYFCFTTNYTTVTNKRLITHVVETPGLCSSKQTSSERIEVLELKDVHDVKQLQSAIPSSRNKWWMQCLEFCACRFENQRIDWVQSFQAEPNASAKEKF